MHVVQGAGDGLCDKPSCDWNETLPNEGTVDGTYQVFIWRSSDFILLVSICTSPMQKIKSISELEQTPFVVRELNGQTLIVHFS